MPYKESPPSPPATPLPPSWSDAERMEWLASRPHTLLLDQASLQRPLRHLSKAVKAAERQMVDVIEQRSRRQLVECDGRVARSAVAALGVDISKNLEAWDGIAEAPPEVARAAGSDFHGAVAERAQVALHATTERCLEEDRGGKLRAAARAEELEAMRLEAAALRAQVDEIYSRSAWCIERNQAELRTSAAAFAESCDALQAKLRELVSTNGAARDAERRREEKHARLLTSHREQVAAALGSGDAMALAEADDGGDGERLVDAAGHARKLSREVLAALSARTTREAHALQVEDTAARLDDISVALATSATSMASSVRRAQAMSSDYRSQVQQKAEQVDSRIREVGVEVEALLLRSRGIKRG